jgi:hypothetical protein
MTPGVGESWVDRQHEDYLFADSVVVELGLEGDGLEVLLGLSEVLWICAVLASVPLVGNEGAVEIVLRDDELLPMLDV